MLDPQRAVLVEGGDALRGRHELRAGLVGRRMNEVHNGLFGLAVVPGRERIILSLRLGSKTAHGVHDGCKQCPLILGRFIFTFIFIFLLLLFLSLVSTSIHSLA